MSLNVESCFVTKSIELNIAILTYYFSKPGLYYFQSEGGHSGEVHSAVVHVRERQQEYKVEVLDRSFNPPIVVIEEGDRIWWQWDKVKV